jgi:hypothetical protein
LEHHQFAEQLVGLTKDLLAMLLEKLLRPSIGGFLDRRVRA